MSFGGNKV